MRGQANGQQAKADSAAVTVKKESPKKSQPRNSKPKKKPASRFAAMNQKKLESRIESLTQQMQHIDAQLADGDTYRNGAKVKQLHCDRDRASKELAELEEEWLTRAQ